jgi:streptogramin lyase
MTPIRYLHFCSHEHFSPNEIAAGPDGALWFTKVTANQIGRITTTGTFTEFPAPMRLH